MRSNNPADLNRAADTVLARMKANRDLIEVEDNRTSPGIEWDLAVDREAAGRYGVDVSTIGQAIQFVTNGILVGKFRPDDSRDELDIRLRFPESDRSITAFDQLFINTPLGPGAGQLFRQARAGPAGDQHPAPQQPAAGCCCRPTPPRARRPT